MPMRLEPQITSGDKPVPSVSSFIAWKKKLACSHIISKESELLPFAKHAEWFLVPPLDKTAAVQ